MAGKIKGIVAPITTPFVNEEVSIGDFKANVAKYAKTPLSGLLTLGSNGENKCLSEHEKYQVLETAVDGKGDHQVVMAGCGYDSTRLTLEFGRKAIELGADYVSLLTPSYFKKSLTDDVLIGYYTDVAEALTKPVLIYNAPSFTGITLSNGVVAKLSQHPNIAGMKDTSPAGTPGYLSVVAEDFDILAGTVNTLLPGMFLGATGGVVSLADAFPEKCCELYDKFVAGDLEGALAAHKILFRLNQKVSGAAGVAGVKYAMDLAGYFGGPPRLPLNPISEQAKKTIKDAVEAAGLL